MIVHFVEFETTLSEAEVLAVANDRLPTYQAVPGLIQKFYLKLDKPNHYGGFHVWRSAEDLAAFRETETAKSLPEAYRMVGAPTVRVHNLYFTLRDMAELEAA